jgi:hypothetical protein
MNMQNLCAGLLKARRTLANEIAQEYLKSLDYHLMKIAFEGPDWRIGKYSNWAEVREIEHTAFQLTLQIERLVMATKPKGKKRGSSMDQYSFIRCEMRAEDKKVAKIWIEENADNFGSKLHDAIASGYKFSCSFSSDYDTFTCSLTGKPDECVNEFKTLTARHKDWVVAALTVLYKHEIMFKSGVWESVEDTEDEGWS